MKTFIEAYDSNFDLFHAFLGKKVLEELSGLGLKKREVKMITKKGVCDHSDIPLVATCSVFEKEVKISVLGRERIHFLVKFKTFKKWFKSDTIKSEDAG